MRLPRRSALTPLLLLAVSSMAGCGAAADVGPPVAVQAVAATVPSGLTRYTDARHHVQVTFPSSWRRARGRLTPNLADPRDLLSVGTAALVVDQPNGCVQMPVAALDRLGPGDALVSLLERRDPGHGYPPRPRHFRLTEANRSTAIECLSDPARRDTWWRPFRDGERAFYALVAIGRPAPAAQRRVAERILDSLRLTDTETAG